ncbi:MAG: uroporphyrinogen-III C-methyltransferase [Sumerlaeia bacterium]
MAGKVFLVGGGPGDPGLLTRRACDILVGADVVLYDALIGQDLLDLAPPDAERIYVGKRGGKPSMSQTEINEALIQHARGGKRTVRLKGGDPYLYGRGGEEALACREAGIPVEVVPGISSVLAVPAYAGIPVLQRGLAGSVLVLHGRVEPVHKLPRHQQAPHGEDFPPSGALTPQRPGAPDSSPRMHEEDGSRATSKISHAAIMEAMASGARTAEMMKRRKPGIKIRRRHARDHESGESAIMRLLSNENVEVEEATERPPTPILTTNEDTGTSAPFGAARVDAPQGALFTSEVDWEAVCAAADTLVILMPMATLDDIRDGLLSGGRPQGQPVACIQWGTTSRQRVCVATVADFPERIRGEGVEAPALLVVGEVVNLREELNFFERQPLFGWRVAVTRSRHRAEETLLQLREGGAEARAFPLTTHSPVAGLSSELEALQDDLAQSTHLVFNSPRGVQSFFDALWSVGLDLRVLSSRARILAAGGATLDALRERNVVAHAIHPPFTPKAMRDIFGPDLSVSRVTIVESVGEHGDLAEELENRGASVLILPLYESVPDASQALRLAHALRDEEVDAVTFFSISAVDAFARVLEEEDARDLLSGVVLAAISDGVAQALGTLGVEAQVVASQPTSASLVQALCRYKRQGIAALSNG